MGDFGGWWASTGVTPMSSSWAPRIAMTRFTNDECIDFDNNPVERAIRPVALGRKNALSTRSEDRAAR